MSLGADHSTGGAIIGGTLKRLGLGGGIIRYACEGRRDVNITPGEIKDLKANNEPVGIVCEHQANWLLLPGVGGRVAASRQIARACGLPDGVIYMAADFDATNGGPTSPGSPGDRNMQAISAALSVAAGVIGKQNVGFYGSYFAIDWLVHHAPWVQWFWQTEAWSFMGRDRTANRHPRAQFFQRASSMNVAGVQCDVNEIWKPNWGQRTGAPAPAPEPKPVPKPAAAGPSGKARALIEFDTANKGWDVVPQKGTFKPGGEDRYASLELQFNEAHGHWRKKPLDWNAPPLGK